MDTTELTKKMDELENRLVLVEQIVNALKNPSELPPEILKTLQSLGL